MAMGDFNAAMVPATLSGTMMKSGPREPLRSVARQYWSTWRDYDEGRAPTIRVPAIPEFGDYDGYWGDTTRAAAYVDVNGDGVTDVVETRMNGTELQSKTWLNQFRPPVIEWFPNGTAAKTHVAYDSITGEAKAQFYTDEPPPFGQTFSAGQTYLAAPLRVVTLHRKRRRSRARDHKEHNVSL